MPILLWLMLAAISPTKQAAQAVPPTVQIPTPEGVAINRIERALAHEPVLRPQDAERVFRVEVFGKKPTIFDFIGRDVLKGPVPHGSSAHQEFLKQVTPEDLQGYAMYSNKEGAVVAALSTAEILIWRSLVESLGQARAALRNSAAQNKRNELRAELAALTRARAAAGLPPK